MINDLTRKQRYSMIIAYFTHAMPEANTELVYHSPFELLVAVILSAQCTDKRVNLVTPKLFAAYPTAEAMAQAAPEELFSYIRSVSYPQSKSKYLVGMAKELVRVHQGSVPDTLERLMALPGVGRKTANVILSVVYDRPAMAVDTHVMRVSKRLGLVDETLKTPLAIEKALMAYLPRKHIRRAHHWLILHGRYTCKAVKPLCSSCPFTSFCVFFQNHTSY